MRSKRTRPIAQRASSESSEHFERLESQTVYHVPVMLQECCDALVTTPDGVYVDGTMGGGGHTAEILRRLSAQGCVHAFDADEQAHEECRRRFADELASQDAEGNCTSRLVMHLENFFMVCSIKKNGKPLDEEFLDGILLDLGVSSRQLDAGGIGLSYRVNSRLDMRFGSHLAIPTAASLIATSNQSDLEWMLRQYGEEPFAKSIARRIVDVRRANATSNNLRPSRSRRIVCSAASAPSISFAGVSSVSHCRQRRARCAWKNPSRLYSAAQIWWANCRAELPFARRPSCQNYLQWICSHKRTRPNQSQIHNAPSAANSSRTDQKTACAFGRGNTPQLPCQKC